MLNNIVRHKNGMECRKSIGIWRSMLWMKWMCPPRHVHIDIEDNKRAKTLSLQENREDEQLLIQINPKASSLPPSHTLTWPSLTSCSSLFFLLFFLLFPFVQSAVDIDQIFLSLRFFSADLTDVITSFSFWWWRRVSGLEKHDEGSPQKTKIEIRMISFTRFLSVWCWDNEGQNLKCTRISLWVMLFRWKHSVVTDFKKRITESDIKIAQRLFKFSFFLVRLEMMLNHFK